jgi:hypothetical protein
MRRKKKKRKKKKDESTGTSSLIKTILRIKKSFVAVEGAYRAPTTFWPLRKLAGIDTKRLLLKSL